ALSLVYPEGYGADFFTSEQYSEFVRVLYEENPQTFTQLVSLLRAATQGKSGNRDARGLYSATAGLNRAAHVHVDGSALAADELIDFERFYEEEEILYVHLNSGGLPLLSRSLGKLMLFSLVATATQREMAGRKRQAFVCIDEFQELAARNVVDL